MRKLSPCNRILAFLTASFLLFSCAPSAQAWEGNGAVRVCEPMTAQELADLFSDTVFFGESTTAHLSRRGGILDTPAMKGHVWRDGSGTRMLDRRLFSSPVLYKGENGGIETLSFADALAREHPARLVLSFGLNGIRTHAKEPARFLSTYRFVLDGIRAISPETEILLQSVYPIGKNTVFSADVDTVNREIRTINEALCSACKEWGDVRFVDTASLLADADGMLRPDFDAGDGIHLTNAAYHTLLSYLGASMRK